MKPCDEYRLRIFLYLDDELRGRDLTDFESHLQECEACRDAVDDQRRFLSRLRSGGPLYSAPAELRSRVEAIVNAPQDPAARRLPGRLRGLFKQAFTAPEIPMAQAASGRGRWRWLRS